MASADTVDPYLVTALKLLHSTAPDSAEKIRLMLDSEITKSHDKSKLITNFLTKKQLNDEKTAPGSGFKKHKPKKPEEVKNIRVPTPPDVTMIADDDSDSSAGSESAMNDLMDLTCVTCRQMDNSANNRLFECVECHLLIHQLCHAPKISNETSLESWVCSSCKGKKEESSNQGSSKSAKSYESSSSSSSSSKKPTLNIVSSTDKKKSEVIKKKSSSSSSSSSRSRSSKK